jgi:hypothetical protein
METQIAVVVGLRTRAWVDKRGFVRAKPCTASRPEGSVTARAQRTGNNIPKNSHNRIMANGDYQVEIKKVMTPIGNIADYFW